MSQLTRRQMAGALAFAAPVLSQQPPSGAAPTAAQDLEAAKDRNRTMAKELAAVSLPMSTEPSFQFKA